MVAGTDNGTGVMILYPHQVGIKSNGLGGGSNSYVVQVGCTWNPTNPIGFQTTAPFNDTDFAAAVKTAAAACGDLVEEIVSNSAGTLGLDFNSAATIQQANQELSANQVND
jgi:hypothetical protein